MNDQPVIDWAAAGLPDATARADDFDSFYVAELPRLVALARALSGPALCEDVAQEAMLAAYRRWSHVKALERPDLWVRRVCANLAVSQFRRRMVEVRALTRFGNRPQPLAEIPSASQELWLAVRRLPPRQAQVTALRFVCDMTIDEIATALATSPGTVKQHLHRARQTLAMTLGLESEAAT